MPSSAFSCHSATTIEFSALSTSGSAFDTVTFERRNSYSETDPTSYFLVTILWFSTALS